MTVETVPTDANVRMSATTPLQHMCPFVHEVDNGTATVSWDSSGWTFELHSLRAYLQSFQEREISHEDLTAEIQAELTGRPGITGILVETAWRTAGMEVLCSTSPTLVGRP